MDVRCALVRGEIIETGRRNTAAASARDAARCLENVGIATAAKSLLSSALAAKDLMNAILALKRG
jgi:hypothetical protein